MNWKRFAWQTATVVVTLLALLVLWQMSVAVAIFLCALALGACMYPLVEHLQERGWSRGVSIGLAVAGSLTLVIGFFGALAVPIATDVQRLSTDLTVAFEESAELYPDHWLLKSLRPPAEPATNTETDDATPAPPPVLAQAMRSVLGTAGGLFELGAHVAICIALSVYWTIDRQRIERLWLSLVPVKRRQGAQKMAGAVERELGAYLRAELAQGLLATMLLWAGFYVLGFRYAALAALVAAILSLLPWLGNVFAVGAVLVLSSGKLMDLEHPWITAHGWMAAAYVAIVIAFLQFVIEPRLFNRERYNALWTVLVTIALTYSFGIWGLLFGPAVGYSLQILVRQIHPLVFYEPTRFRSLDNIAVQVAQLRERYPRETTPPEILSFVDRLESIVEARAVAETT
jgi:predicted PurR-regulated permease PerM